jgi:CRP/FNR family cyclic AMP-dependent transcriptional regulator
MILRENTDSQADLTDRSASRQNQRLVDLEPSLQEHVRQSSRQRTFQSGATLFAQGARHTHTYMVEDGLVRTYYTASSGREITLAYWSKGDIIGGPNFFGEGYHCWSGVAARTTSTLAISGSNLRTLANRHPQISMWLTDVLIFKLRWMSVLLQLHGTESVQCRLAKLILMLGDIYGVSKGEEVVIKHRINQSDLATLVGASRQWTNKMLRDLQAEGLLYMRDRHITISAVSKLRQFVGEQFE